ncbi:phosphatidate cytidylyltransferase [Acidovorax sp. SUPP950]|uniref:phosphatidate cytidylyltransferase n=1 Tax=unclassified Acidovorax TaxID=2684926 RepID=UPI00234B68F7|nr:MULTISPECIES: phosphatidate cytidylyltransferase [unclassified Acidovorax]WCM98564.1 phosphatidate cytidylyltransferase [Acidovorax sp. GBBC 1281]GKS74940.1 phosphatidate cytidylyltransferase [Acidovorax sp. SUPP950]GKS84812.1 phosphatidate cytidylyltransferase [Acidovorax sp. SUPP1855]GKS87797.1 phosphatidate cytidylyltransferase [Acidovorax sp. SUPP2539]GKS92939.1 phosphatidate cytidylyltransferase [Acidovorax sp. SUPP2825]
MNDFLRNLTTTQQIGALFVAMFGLLSLVTLYAFFQTLREARGTGVQDQAEHEAHQQEWRRFWSLLKTSWFMATVFWVGWALGDTVATVLFAIVAFFALREFITLSPTRRGDHRSLVLAFFVVLPLQFILVGTRKFDLFTVFIPVYVFLALPVASALANDPERFLERNAKLQWGIMVCVYGMSHVPALLLLDFPGYEGKGAFLVFFLVVVVQAGVIAQHLLGRRFPHKPVAPQVSQSFQWLSWASGVAVGGVAGVMLSFITPFKPGQALGMALLACLAGSLGHLVMKALKRDRGITSWGMQGQSVTGAGGLLDRVDALCFAAPVFFHSVRWYFGL